MVPLSRGASFWSHLPQIRAPPTGIPGAEVNLHLGSHGCETHLGLTTILLSVQSCARANTGSGWTAKSTVQHTRVGQISPPLNQAHLGFVRIAKYCN